MSYLNDCSKHISIFGTNDYLFVDLAVITFSSVQFRKCWKIVVGIV